MNCPEFLRAAAWAWHGSRDGGPRCAGGSERVPVDSVTEAERPGQALEEPVSLQPSPQRSGGHPPFTQIFQEHFPFVWRCLRGLGVNDADLDDSSQEVFLVVHRRLAELDPERELRPWLYGILRLVAQNHRRGRRRSMQRQQALAQEPLPAAPGPLESLQTRDAARIVSAILPQLEETRREVFLLVELEGMSVTEAASALGVPLNTAYSRLRLARADFKAALARRGAP